MPAKVKKLARALGKLALISSCAASSTSDTESQKSSNAIELSNTKKAVE